MMAIDPVPKGLADMVTVFYMAADKQKRPGRTYDFGAGVLALLSWLVDDEVTIEEANRLERGRWDFGLLVNPRVRGRDCPDFTITSREVLRTLALSRIDIRAGRVYDGLGIDLEERSDEGGDDGSD